jgi:hypothetical protein
MYGHGIGDCKSYPRNTEHDRPIIYFDKPEKGGVRLELAIIVAIVGGLLIYFLGRKR